MESEDARRPQAVTLHAEINRTFPKEEPLYDYITDQRIAADNYQSDPKHERDLEYDYVDALITDDYDYENYDEGYYDEYDNGTYGDAVGPDNGMEHNRYQDLLKSIDELEKNLQQSAVASEFDTNVLLDDFDVSFNFDDTNVADMIQNGSVTSDSDDGYEYYTDDSLFDFGYNDKSFLLEGIFSDDNDDVVVPGVQTVSDARDSTEISITPSKTSQTPSEYLYDFDDVLADMVDVENSNYLQDMPSSGKNSKSDPDLLSDFSESTVSTIPNSHKTSTANTNFVRPFHHSKSVEIEGDISNSDYSMNGIDNRNVEVVPDLIDVRGEVAEINDIAAPHKVLGGDRGDDLLLPVKTETIYPDDYFYDEDYESSNGYENV